MTSSAPGRVLGIDYGGVRVGLALTDPLRIVASGAGVMENGPGLAAAIAELAVRENVALILVGMPYAPDGGAGEQGEKVKRFIRALADAVPVPVETWDESGSSRKAVRAMIEGGMKKKRRQEKWRHDEMAARLLLQEFIDHQGTKA